MAVHEVGRRLPPHQWVLPSVSFGEGIPIHKPMMCMPIAGLGSGFSWAVDSMRFISLSLRAGFPYPSWRHGEPYRTVRA
jgi:hypothetical protein